jgi:C1A family cysteine protease
MIKKIITTMVIATFVFTSLTTTCFSYNIDVEEAKSEGINLKEMQFRYPLINYEPVSPSIPRTEIVVSSGLPSSLDWRNYDGYDWTTRAKDQGECGSCWAFSVVGAVESACEIANNAPTFNPDFSEQEVISCTEPQGGNHNNCSGGNPYHALQTIKEIGALYEKCYPYGFMGNNPDNLPCHYGLCNDRVSSSEIVSIVLVDNDLSKEKIKQQLQKGPVSLGMDVYVDFWWSEPGKPPYDENNIYHHGTSDESPIGYHSVLCVGYNDYPGYWICKNSWGQNWGNMEGFFNIAYGECCIESRQMTSLEFKQISNKPPETPNSFKGTGNMQKGDVGWYYLENPVIDPDGDQLYYMINFGDGTYSGWKGPYESGEWPGENKEFGCSHEWTTAGNFIVKAIARDEHDAESGWSNEITVNVQRKNKFFIKFLFSQRIFRLMDIFIDDDLLSRFT